MLHKIKNFFAKIIVLVFGVCVLAVIGNILRDFSEKGAPLFFILGLIPLFIIVKRMNVTTNKTGKTLENFEGTPTTIPEYLQLIKDYISNNNKTFREKLLIIKSHSEKYIKKREMINKTLLVNLNKNELTYIKFNGILVGIDVSIKKTLNDVLVRLTSFDEDEYEQILKKPDILSNTYNERRAIFKDYTDYINSSVKFLDGMLVKLDKLQLEINKLKSLDLNNIDNIDSIKNIDDLIDILKFYKSL
ncbi:MAG: hypothetical protein LBI10_10850 [Deltaproteobacteria bacterium]|jgi:uncharacterized Fe-S cluster-containing radical SAM superfamily protein|nr:hypothetical protein [Deltaproteobacteria bacterium]